MIIPHHSHVSTMWLEIIVTVRPPEFKMEHSENKTIKTYLLKLWKHIFSACDGRQQREVCLLSLTSAIILFNKHHFNFLSWHLNWSGKTEGIPFPFFPRGGGLINFTTLSGPAEYIYFVLGEWWPKEKECAQVWLKSDCYILNYNP